MRKYLAEDPVQSRPAEAGHSCVLGKAIAGKKGEIAKGEGWQQYRYVNRASEVEKPCQAAT